MSRGLEMCIRDRAWEFAMEKGLDYPVGDQAGGLSVGQAQRLALQLPFPFPINLFCRRRPPSRCGLRGSRFI
ncbi:hypothetical protein, partial [Aeromonas salmonicida]|uniref:hypothetical protein n=1 Tax=Aeromonas salmonicida TaxID=645 RepID=UPI003D321CAB